MPLFNDENKLLDAIRKDMELALADIGGEIEEIVKQNVKEFVYDPWEPTDEWNRVYERRYENGGFLGSWTHKKVVQANSKKAATVILSDPELMTVSQITKRSQRPAYSQYSDDIFLKVLDDLSEITDLVETEDATDRRDIMDEAIAEGTNYDFEVPSDKGYGEEDNWWTRPRDYWSPAIAYVDANFDDIVNYSLAKYFEIEW